MHTHTHTHANLHTHTHMHTYMHTHVNKYTFSVACSLQQVIMYSIEYKMSSGETVWPRILLFCHHPLLNGPCSLQNSHIRAFILSPPSPASPIPICYHTCSSQMINGGTRRYLRKPRAETPSHSIYTYTHEYPAQGDTVVSHTQGCAIYA